MNVSVSIDYHTWDIHLIMSNLIGIIIAVVLSTGSTSFKKEVTVAMVTAISWVIPVRSKY